MKTQWLAPVRMARHYLNGWIQSIPYRLPMPLAWQEVKTDRQSVEESMLLALDFLRLKQRRDGSFRGFLLPPGFSDGWIPAHIGLVLEDVPAARAICADIARWLSRHGPDDGGWGYNRIVGIDNDSTAQALMVLRRQGYDCPRFLVENLVASQHRDGGFPTYRPDRSTVTPNNWQQPHADISLLVYALLSRENGFEKEKAAARDWLQSQYIDGRLPAFWWEGDWYNDWAMRKAGWDNPWAMRKADLDNRQPEGNTVSSLIATQLADGSWSCAPLLRLPPQTGTFHHSPVRVFADPFRVFSTAHAVAELHRLCFPAKGSALNQYLPGKQPYEQINDRAGLDRRGLQQPTGNNYHGHRKGSQTNSHHITD